MRKIAIGALGGTIAMVADEGGGAKPTLSVEMLAKSVVGLSLVADIHAETLEQLPSASLSFEVLFKALQWARHQVDEGACSVILTQGTDSLEETSFFFSLYWDKSQPLILTGAMRTPLSAGADGPANLLAAAHVGIDAKSINAGVLVVMNDTIHSPYFIRKCHTVKVDAFQSGFVGPLGFIVEGKPVYSHNKSVLKQLLPLPITSNHKVALVQSCLSAGSDQLKLVLNSGIYQGVVIAGFGAGHVNFEEADILRDYAKELPLVVASRTNDGPTTKATYGYKGSEIDLMEGGILMSGWLTPLKARLLLWAFLADGKSLADIKQCWQEWALH